VSLSLPTLPRSESSGDWLLIVVFFSSSLLRCSRVFTSIVETDLAHEIPIRRVRVSLCCVVHRVRAMDHYVDGLRHSDARDRHSVEQMMIATRRIDSMGERLATRVGMIRRHKET